MTYTLSHPSIPALLQSRQSDPNLAQRVKRLGLWQRITWQEHINKVERLATQLIELGLQPSNKMAILCENRPEWLIADLAIQSIGAVSVGIYTTSSPQQVKYILEHSDAKGIILENAEQIEKWLEIAPSLPQVKWVIAIEPEGFGEALIWDDLLSKPANSEALQARIHAIKAEDLALLMYTSGTTGHPKGVMLSHQNLLWATDALIKTAGYNSKDEIVSYLPLSHIVERLGSYCHIKAGFVINFVENLDTFAQNLQEIRPTVLFAVPRIWEKMHALVELHMQENHLLKRSMYQWAMKAVAGGSQKNFGGNLAALLANISVVQALKYRLGIDRLRLAISGAAPVSPHILLYFCSLGIDMREGYGMTENSALATIHQSRKDFKLGTVGSAYPDVEIQIAQDGEILTKSPGTFLGYYKDEAATQATLTGEWLHTGDIGEIDEDGHLTITDRKKDIIITAGGKNIAPQKIENLLKTSPFIGDAVVIGDKRKYLVALIVLDEDNISTWARDRQITYTTYGDLSTHEEVYGLIEQEIAKANKELARVEGIKRFAILPKRLYYEDGEVTATLKVKRSSVSQKYAPLIDSLYQGS
ncbi:MAG: long-chain fatty acid--CoA ligase [Deinococcales bacterium]